MNDYLTLLNLAMREGVDLAVGVIDACGVVAPEIEVIRGRPIAGTSYNLDVIRQRGTGAFRSANEGVVTTKNKYGKEAVECMIFDTQMEVDKAVADAHPHGRDTFLTEETLDIGKGSFQTLGKQVYYGVQADNKGFSGLEAFTVTNSALRVDAGGSTASKQTSIYAIFEDLQGVKFVYGANGSIDTDEEWAVQKIVRDGKSLKCYCNGILFWIGLQIAPLSVVRIANIDASNPGNDQVIADALRKLPTSRKPSRLLMNRDSSYYLQKSRSSTSVTNSGQKDSTGQGTWAPEPTESNGVPITVTDSIVSTEPVVSF